MLVDIKMTHKHTVQTWNLIESEGCGKLAFLILRQNKRQTGFLKSLFTNNVSLQHTTIKSDVCSYTNQSLNQPLATLLRGRYFALLRVV